VNPTRNIPEDACERYYDYLRSFSDLVGRGQIEQDAPLIRYLPDFKMASSGYEKITIRMLLNHPASFSGTDYRNVIGQAPISSYYE
jgi:CubicO group peptidase (beta-lactamase class C family)